jgi:hypothetical protein
MNENTIHIFVIVYKVEVVHPINPPFVDIKSNYEGQRAPPTTPSN